MKTVTFRTPRRSLTKGERASERRQGPVPVPMGRGGVAGGGEGARPVDEGAEGAGGRLYGRSLPGVPRRGKVAVGGVNSWDLSASGAVAAVVG